MATSLADGVSLASVRLHLDSAFYDYEADHGRPNRVPLAWLRGRFRREFPGMPFDEAILSAVRADARYDAFPDPAATAEETAGGVRYDGVVAVFVGRIDDQYLNEVEASQKPATAPSVPQAAEQPNADGSPVVPPDFVQAIATAWHDAAIEGEGEVVPLAALRMTLDWFTDDAFDAGLRAVLAAGEYVLVEIRGFRPSRMIQAGALEVDGREWYWITRRPAWGRGGEGGAA